MGFPGTWMTESESVIYRVVPKCACSTIGQIMFYSDHGRFFDGDIHDSTEGLHKWAQDASQPKIEANVRAHVLPPHRAEAPLVAVLDLTALGSGKDAVALTPDALYAKEFDETCGFAFEELQAAHPPKGLMGKTVRAQLQSRAVKVPCGGDGDALHAMLSAVLQARG